jgi:proteasome lid subunit RPN8/RPN11
MSMLSWIQSFFAPVAPKRTVFAPVPKFIVTQACLQAIQTGLEPEMRKGHEGIVYLLGRTDGVIALATTVFRPRATTTPGSFHVEPRAMAACVQTAGRFELQVVGQLHTHPGEAYHSDGDVEGAHIRYPGYISIVLPNYGRLLPNMNGAAMYMWGADDAWRQLGPQDLIIIPGAGPWTSSTGMTGATTAPSVTHRVV